jgi:hypothetical protein
LRVIKGKALVKKPESGMNKTNKEKHGWHEEGKIHQPKI